MGLQEKTGNLILLVKLTKPKHALIVTYNQRILSDKSTLYANNQLWK